MLESLSLAKKRKKEEALSSKYGTGSRKQGMQKGGEFVAVSAQSDADDADCAQTCQEKEKQLFLYKRK
ncbi:MAG: hypothetical protein WC966_05895 [Bradymonadales bacterium]